jgi:hypothetical protein
MNVKRELFEMIISFLVLLVFSGYRVIAGVAMLATYPWDWFSINIHGMAIISGFLGIGALYGLFFRRKLGLALISVDLFLNLINRFLLYGSSPMFQFDVLYALVVGFCVYLEYRHSQKLDDIPL